MDENLNNVPEEVNTKEIPEGTTELGAEQNVEQNAEQSAEQNVQQKVQQETEGQQQNTAYQYSYGNNQYQSYNYNNSQQNVPIEEDTSVMSMGDWLLTLLALLIPCVGIVLYFVWGFSRNQNVNRRNYCRAYLIYWGITTVLSVVVIVIVAALMAASGGYYYS